MSRSAFVATLAGLLLVGLVAAGAGQVRPLSRALLPAASFPVADPHPLHPPGEPGCAVCHPEAEGSRWASDRLAPRMERCAPCHPAAAGVAPATAVTPECRKCHTRLGPNERPAPALIPRPNVRFSHAAHRGEGCASCHPRAAAAAPRSGERDVMGMPGCLECHRGLPGKRAACRTCHLVHADGRMVTRVGGAVLTPPSWLDGPSHGPEWVGTHAARAGADSRSCASCHREKECQDCHTGRLRPARVHPGDWIAAHGLSTRLDNPSCRSCHRTQSFCLGCHRRSGVAPDSPAAARPPGSGRYHGGMAVRDICRRARYDIVGCASCHSEGSCIRCHARIDPHPAGWSRRCGPLARRNQGACVKCHDGDIWRRCQ
jgi:hypothetical protein